MTGTLPSRTGMLAWRLARHGLIDPPADDAVAVVRRLLAVRAWPDAVATTAVGLRSTAPPDAHSAVRARELVVSYAFGGGSYVLAPDVAAAILSTRAATESWRTARWQRQGGFEIDDWQPLREAVRARLRRGAATRAEIGAHLAGIPALAHLATAAASGAGADALLKPLHWWGDIGFGPSRNGLTTFRLLADDPSWPGTLEADDAGRTLVRLVLGSYGAASVANLEHWIADGLGVRRQRLLGWIDDLGDEVARLDVDGVERLCLAADAAAIADAAPSDAVRLLPGHDPWIMVPGTADAALVASDRRALATRGASLVLHGGVAAGTWRRTRDALTVTWFEESGPVPDDALAIAVERLGVALDAALVATVRRA